MVVLKIVEWNVTPSKLSPTNQYAGRGVTWDIRFLGWCSSFLQPAVAVSNPNQKHLDSSLPCCLRISSSKQMIWFTAHNRQQDLLWFLPTWTWLDQYRTWLGKYKATWHSCQARTSWTWLGQATWSNLPWWLGQHEVDLTNINLSLPTWTWLGQYKLDIAINELEGQHTVSWKLVDPNCFFISVCLWDAFSLNIMKVSTTLLR